MLRMNIDVGTKTCTLANGILCTLKTLRRVVAFVTILPHVI